MNEFIWRKKGRIYDPEGKSFSHSSHPCVTHLEGDKHLLAFTCRDKQQKSHIFLATIKVSKGRISFLSEPKMALAPGQAGYFDCDGAISGCFVRNGNNLHLYYVGWQNLPEDLWLCDTGRSTVNLQDMTITRDFPGPVIARDKTKPLFAAATAFYITPDNIWHCWFNTGISWTKKDDGGWHHKYGLHHGTSKDGIDWDCETEMCIPFADEYEYAFGRPSIVHWNNRYHMWYAHRATKDIDAYRMGYAYSDDLVNWHRADGKSGIDVSHEGWDSEMICYPCVFEHKGIKYMFYNGNGYGKTGIGYAILEED